MLSLIICSRDPEALRQVSNNVAVTIGVAYEIIAIDNSAGQYGICEAYNLGAKQAQYELLCFMHEDIRFHTSNWGLIVARLLKDESIGVLGVTGGQHQVAAPAPWWGCGLELCRENVLNVFEDGTRVMELRNPEQVPLTDVAVVDGMWMCCRRSLWEQFPFDSKTFVDFHFYDIDFCTEIFHQGKRICVTYEITLEHHSRGSINASWVHNALLYQEKRNNQLPFGVISLKKVQSVNIELKAYQAFVSLLMREKFSNAIIYKYLKMCWSKYYLHRDTLWLTKEWLKNNMLSFVS
ncbi:glycosyltransferase [Solirubrum puertoriconensis]|uniref:Streptomycin biosynthesis protein StrF domain-containing protein n=1 Tax=Solirubrum puertoriconensis TaxID=1751427 RepID=A0A9X0HNV7_SOLP1|nr:glycosyltransferase [Solirubrum puertoriconensis]KUG09537.1 hypothetical protein ASU33_17665 [Solirubrum puertoriconensis]